MKGIILSGMPAVGKTTAAFSLCKEFNLNYYSGGDLLKELAKKKAMKSLVLIGGMINMEWISYPIE